MLTRMPLDWDPPFLRANRHLKLRKKKKQSVARWRHPFCGGQAGNGKGISPKPTLSPLMKYIFFYSHPLHLIFKFYMFTTSNYFSIFKSTLKIIKKIIINHTFSLRDLLIMLEFLSWKSPVLCDNPLSTYVGNETFTTFLTLSLESNGIHERLKLSC